MPQLLVIDDDLAMTQLLAELLAPDYDITAAPTATEGLAHLNSRHVDLVLLDVMLPDLDGFETLRRIRRSSQIPVLMLTARGEADDRIRGLETGADDYLPKPFHDRELRARLHALLRRTAATDQPLTIGDLTLDPRTRHVHRASEYIPLTTAEFDLLHRLLNAAGSPVSRDTLSETVLGRPYSVLDRSIDNLVSIVRKKLGPAPDGTDRLVTVRGLGYQYSAQS